MHIPVLTNEVIQFLEPKSNENFVDCTIGNGGHAKEILERNGPKGKVLGIDWDEEQIKNLRVEMKNYTGRLVLINDNFANLKDIVEQEKFKRISGILFDLGVSSDHFEKSGRGFSFQRNEILDMRLNLRQGIDAKKILNFWSRFDIEKILKEYGEERFAESIAKAIVQERSKSPITKTFELVNIIKSATPGWYARAKIHPATKTFQALRIAVNSELENLVQVLPQAVSLLVPGGRIAVISFHSLEDRIVKVFFKEEKSIRIITKKPVVAGYKEQRENPRSRSAKLRAAVKL